VFVPFATSITLSVFLSLEISHLFWLEESLLGTTTQLVRKKENNNPLNMYFTLPPDNRL